MPHRWASDKKKNVIGCKTSCTVVQEFTTKIGMGTDLKGNTSHNVVMSFHSPSICVTVSPHRPWIKGFILLFTISESQKIYKGFLSPRTQVPSMRPLTAHDPHCGAHKIWSSQHSPVPQGACRIMPSPQNIHLFWSTARNRLSRSVF